MAGARSRCGSRSISTTLDTLQQQQTGLGATLLHAGGSLAGRLVIRFHADDWRSIVCIDGGGGYASTGQSKSSTLETSLLAPQATRWMLATSFSSRIAMHLYSSLLV